MGTFRVDRVPQQPRRLARSMGRLKNSDNVVAPDEAIQIVDSVITFVIATGEPFTQSASGLVLKLDPAGEDILSTSSAGLNIDENELYSFSLYYG